MPKRGPTKYPPTGKNYARPRFDRSGKKWSAPRMVSFIRSKPHWDAYDFKNELRISIEHARYLVLVANLPKLKQWHKN